MPGVAPRVVLAGSAAELGPIEVADLPVGEDHPCRPAESYGLSKLLATAAGLAARPPLEVMAARIFNPIGPGQPPTQALGRFAVRLAEGPPMPLTVGDLDVRRDFIDVRDVARALIALAERGRAGLVYHVGTGQSRRVGEGLDYLIRLSGRAVEVKADPRAAQIAGPRDSRTDIRRIVTHTGWRPEGVWEQSLADLWDEARSRAVAIDRLNRDPYHETLGRGIAPRQLTLKEERPRWLAVALCSRSSSSRRPCTRSPWRGPSCPRRMA